MPSSSPSVIPEAMLTLMKITPHKILDIGFGWGKYALLSREYLSGLVEDLKIDGVEPFSPYIKEHQKILYDRIINEKIEDIVDSLERYDLIYFMDVIEHLPKEKGADVLTKLLRKTKWLLLSTPNGYYEQGAEFGNELEKHLSGWSKEDLEKFNTVYYIWDNPVQLVYLYKGEIV